MIQLVSFRLSHPIPINLETQLFLVATVTLVTTCDKHCTVAGSEHTKLTPGVGQVAWDGLPCACGKASALSPDRTPTRESAGPSVHNPPP